MTILTFLVTSFFISGAINSQSSKSGDISFLEVAVYSALNMALIITSILGFLPEEARANYIEVSKAASFLFQYKTLWVMLPPIALIVLNFRRK